MHAVVRASLLWLAAVAAFAGQLADPESVRQALQAPGVAALETTIGALAADRRVSELAFHLADVAGDANLQPASRAWLLDRGLHELARLTPTPEAQAVILELSQHQPEVFTKADPDHGDRTTPLYDTGATARFVLQSWQRDAARAEALAYLARGRVDPVGRFAAAGSAGRAGIVAAYAEAPVPQLVPQRDAVAAALAQGVSVDQLALVLARRLADSELATLVLDRAAPGTALAAVRSLPQAFEPRSVIEMLLHARGRRAIASAAMLEIGWLARHHRAARSALLESLEDPELGPSAAAALAGIGDPLVSRELGQRLRDSRSDWSRRMYVLALRLDASPAAREELQRFLDSGRGPAQLQREVGRWLGR